MPEVEIAETSPCADLIPPGIDPQDNQYCELEVPSATTSLIQTKRQICPFPASDCLAPRPQEPSRGQAHRPLDHSLL